MMARLKNFASPRHRLIGCLAAGVAVLLMLGGGPLQAQEAAPMPAGRGVIVEANPFGAYGAFPLDVLNCDTPACRRLLDLTYPRLLAVDPDTRTVTPADASSSALTVRWDIAQDESGLYVLSLRDDLVWSDGTPITAYDVFFTFWNALIAWEHGFVTETPLGSGQAGLTRVVPLDDHTVALLFTNIGCEGLDYVNVRVLPAHVYAPGFTGLAREFFGVPITTRDGFELAAMETVWRQTYGPRDFRAQAIPSPQANDLVTGGLFRLNEVRPNDFIRLTRQGGALAYALVDLPDPLSDTATSLFLTGVTDLIENPPLERWDDIRQVQGVQTATYPGLEWDAIWLNLADRSHPRSHLGADGAVQDQGIHPIFGDRRVRQAVQRAINVEELIEAALLGEGEALGGTILPASWASPVAGLDPVAFDRREAERLLHDAGWKDVNRDGVRECVGCLYARANAPLTFTLITDDSLRHSIVTALLERQLSAVGIALNVYPLDRINQIYSGREQSFDALLLTRTETFPVASDQSAWFAASTDRLVDPDNRRFDLNSNFISYRSAEVEALFDRARNVPACGLDERAALIGEAQALLRADVPVIPLYVPNAFVAASRAVVGFDPRPNMPLWNLTSWEIVR